MLEQTDQTNPGTDVSEKRIHRAVYQRRSVARGGEVGPADRMGRLNLAHLPSRCILAGSLILSSQGRLQVFPCIKLAGTDLKGYIRGLPPLTKRPPLGEASLSLSL